MIIDILSHPLPSENKKRKSTSSVGGNKGFKHFLNHFFEWCLFIEFLGNKLHNFCVVFEFPDTVTAHNYEGIVIQNLFFDNIGKGGNELFLGFLAFILFIFEVSQCSTEVEVSINSSLNDEASRVLNSFVFFIIIRLMVDGKILICTFSA